MGNIFEEVWNCMGIQFHWVWGWRVLGGIGDIMGYFFYGKSLMVCYVFGYLWMGESIHYWENLGRIFVLVGIIYQQKFYFIWLDLGKG